MNTPIIRKVYPMPCSLPQITANGLIVLQDRYWWWKNSFPYPSGSGLSSDDAEAVVASFWSPTDFVKGGNVYYQVSDKNIFIFAFSREI